MKCLNMEINKVNEKWYKNEDLFRAIDILFLIGVFLYTKDSIWLAIKKLFKLFKTNKNENN
jgi:hypothetical protein